MNIAHVEGVSSPVSESAPQCASLLEWWQTAAVFIGTAIGSGVIGNAATDAIKAAVNRARRSKTGDPAPVTRAEAAVLARAAVDQRLTDLGLARLSDSDIAGVEVLEPVPGTRLVHISGAEVNIAIEVHNYVPGSRSIRADVVLITHPAAIDLRATRPIPPRSDRA